MLVHIERDAFNSMDDIPLIWACIEPTIRQIRGKNLAVKSEVASHLSPGQQALLMFQIFYGHSRDGAAGFFSSVNYLLSSRGFWLELEKGMNYFNDHAMAELIKDMEKAYVILGERQSEQIDIAIERDVELKAAINQLDKRLFALIPAAIQLVASNIRTNPAEYVQFDA
jgi:hypothetical protein